MHVSEAWILVLAPPAAEAAPFRANIVRSVDVLKAQLPVGITNLLSTMQHICLRTTA